MRYSTGWVWTEFIHLSKHELFTSFLFLGTEKTTIVSLQPKRLVMQLTSTNYPNSYNEYVYNIRSRGDLSFTELPSCKYIVSAGPHTCTINSLKENSLYTLRLDICLTDGSCSDSHSYDVKTPVAGWIIYEMPIYMYIKLICICLTCLIYWEVCNMKQNTSTNIRLIKSREWSGATLESKSGQLKLYPLKANLWDLIPELSHDSRLSHISWTTILVFTSLPWNLSFWHIA